MEGGSADMLQNYWLISAVSRISINEVNLVIWLGMNVVRVVLEILRLYPLCRGLEILLNYFFILIYLNNILFD